MQLPENFVIFSCAFESSIIRNEYVIATLSIIGCEEEDIRLRSRVYCCQGPSVKARQKT